MVEWRNAQDKVDLTIESPLGKDALMIDALEGVETLSQPFEFRLKLRAKSSEIDFKSLVGKELKVTLNMQTAKRHFCGVVGEIVQRQTPTAEKDIWLTHYEAKIYPTLWLLKFSSDHRIFQNKSALDIIKDIFTDNSLTNFKDKTSKKGKTVREFCVQYGESAFNFVTRLMEEEGIFYFFEHTPGGHQLILADANTAFEKKPAGPLSITRSIPGDYLMNEVIMCSLHQQVVPKKFSTGDFNYELSVTPMRSTTSGEGAGGEIYSYPGIFKKNPEGETIATTRIQELEWHKDTLQGQSTALEITSGYQFSLKNHPRASANKAYVAYEVRHYIDIESETPKFENTFIAFDLKANFSSPLLAQKPRIYGTQTAIVTGKAGEEIWTDKYGRVCVQFHWDRLGKNDEKSSLMIRVAQGWAMSGWGILFTPRIGQEVVVSFIDGDPDRPLITGCVYNCSHLPPYLPGEPTKSTIKTNTSKEGGGFNELRFEDKKGKEQIFIHAQKDMDRIIKNARTLLIEEGNDTETLNKGSRNITLKADDGAVKHTLTINKGDDEISLKEGNLKITLDKGDETHTITGNETHKVTKDVTIEAKNITLKASGNVTIQAGSSLTLKSGTDFTIQAGTALTIKSGTDTKIQAGTQMQLKGSVGVSMDGGPKVEIKSAAMTQVQGAMLQLKGSMIMMG